MDQAADSTVLCFARRSGKCGRSGRNMAATQTGMEPADHAARPRSGRVRRQSIACSASCRPNHCRPGCCNTVLPGGQAGSHSLTPGPFHAKGIIPVSFLPAIPWSICALHVRHGACTLYSGMQCHQRGMRNLPCFFTHAPDRDRSSACQRRRVTGLLVPCGMAVSQAHAVHAGISPAGCSNGSNMLAHFSAPQRTPFNHPGCRHQRQPEKTRSAGLGMAGNCTRPLCRRAVPVGHQY